MSHRYYEEDYDMGITQRLGYFDKQFKTLAKQLAFQQGITLSSFLSDIKDIKSFKAKLNEVFSLDNSLANYVEGMSERSFDLFFGRPLIQNIVQANISNEPEKIETKIIKEPIPIYVQQINKKTNEFFKAKFKDKKTQRIRRTIAKLSKFKIRGKNVERLRDLKGRFVSKY